MIVAQAIRRRVLIERTTEIVPAVDHNPRALLLLGIGANALELRRHRCIGRAFLRPAHRGLDVLSHLGGEERIVAVDRLQVPAKGILDERAEGLVKRFAAAARVAGLLGLQS